MRTPEKWPSITLGEVGRWFGGGTPSKANLRYWTGGTIPWVSPKDMKQPLIDDAQDHITAEAVRESSTNMVEVGSVLVVARSGILQHTLPVAITTRRVALNQDIKAVEPRKDVAPEFLALALKAFEREILQTCTKTGTTVQSLELPVFHRFQIPVPPLPKQRRIVAEIEKQFTRLDAGITALRRTQANLKRYRAAVLKAACEGRLVPTEADLAKHQPSEWGSVPRGRARSNFESGALLLERMLIARRQDWQGSGKYKEPTVIDGRTLPSLPDGWAWASMRQVGEVQLGRQRAPQHHTGDNMRPYLRVANVFEARIDTSDVKEMNFTPVEFEKYQLRFGDILLNEGQTPELVGRPAMFRDEVSECCYQKTLLRFRAYNGVLPHFALTVFRSYMHNRRFTRAASITTNIAHLTAEKFVEIEFPLPPLAEQTRIVAEVERRLSVVEELETAVNANLQRATRLRQSVLQQAFAGQSA